MTAVYLDHNATTPLAPGVLEAMRPYLEASANAASAHTPGQAAREAVDHARHAIRALVDGPEGDVILTGSGTEAVVTAVLGICRAGRARGRHLVTTGMEHAAGLAAAHRLENEGWAVSRVGSDASGRMTPEAVEAALRPDTVLVSMLHANNETGVIQPVEAIAAHCRRLGVACHVDAVQSAGKIPVAAQAWGVDAVSVAAHKLGGPQGVGALWIRPGLPLDPLIPGAQEGGRRGGTQAVAAIVGFGAAARLALAGLDAYAAEIGALQVRLEEAMARHVPSARLTACGSPRLPNTAHFTFPGCRDRDLVLALDLGGYAVSAGSACRSGAEEPSHVLLAMGYDRDEASTAVRVSLGRGNRSSDVDGFVRTLGRLLDTQGTDVSVSLGRA